MSQTNVSHSDATDAQTAPLNHFANQPEMFKTLQGLEKVLASSSIDSGMHHLFLLLVSQINGCAYCVNMHITDALKIGVSQRKVDMLIVWRHCDVFTDQEKAAFAFLEAATALAPDTDWGSLRADLRQHFTDEEITTLTVMSGMINLWNRLQISNH